MDNYIENIILKFFNDDCSSIELEELLDFILIEENYAIFKDYVNINHFATMTLNKFDKSSLINELETRIKKEKSTINQLNIIYNLKLKGSSKKANKNLEKLKLDKANLSEIENEIVQNIITNSI